MNSIALFCSCPLIPFPEVPELGKNRVDREISPPPGIRSMQPEEVQITCFIYSPIRRKGRSICKLAKRFSSFLGIFTLTLLLILKYN